MDSAKEKELARSPNQNRKILIGQSAVFWGKAQKGFRTHKKSGVILLTVLGLILLMSAMVVQFLSVTTDDIRFKSQVYEENDLRDQAYQALEVSLAAIAEINEIDKGLFSPTQGWDNPLQYAQWTPPVYYKIEAKVSDETGKLPLNTKENYLDRFLEENEVASYQIQEVINEFNEWTSAERQQQELEDKERETAMSRKGGQKGGNQPNALEKKQDKGSDMASKDEVAGGENPKKRVIFSDDTKIQDFSEFLSMEQSRAVFYDEEKRQPRDLYWKLKETYSLYNNGTVNINTAPESVRDILKKVVNLDIQTVENFLYPTDLSGEVKTDTFHFYSKKEEVPGNELSNGSNKIALFDVQSHLLLVSITVSRGPVSFLLEALVGLEEKSNTQRDTGSVPSKPTNVTQAQSASRTKSQSKKSLASTDYPFKIIRLTENSFI
ncbi:MAG: hypothetical protein A2007_04170 [Verrucomicrobia bacterium GWC2_42_7]|nr:MAG: hypothetical protein A2007_04170 [Verrucomicrobia bacterium GWC2_42_7]